VIAQPRSSTPPRSGLPIPSGRRGATNEMKAATNVQAQATAPKTQAEIELTMSNAVTQVYSDAAKLSFTKTKAVGSNDLYAVQFMSGKKKMEGEIVGDGTLVMI